ncbi:MAG: phage GP46 family protein [Pseudomonadota bacterium]
MPGCNRRLDPLTRDYVSDGFGGYEKTRTLEVPCYHQLSTHREKWWGDAEAGCDLWKLQREGNSDVNARRAVEMVKLALKPFVDAGLAADLEVTSEHDQLGRMVVRSSMTDVQSGQTLDLSPLVAFGV